MRESNYVLLRPLLTTHCRCRWLFSITLNETHTHTFVRTPLDKGSVQRCSLNLSQHNICNRQYPCPCGRMKLFMLVISCTNSLRWQPNFDRHPVWRLTKKIFCSLKNHVVTIWYAASWQAFCKSRLHCQEIKRKWAIKVSYLNDNSKIPLLHYGPNYVFFVK
jgi:hypothetical protein